MQCFIRMGDGSHHGSHPQLLDRSHECIHAVLGEGMEWEIFKVVEVAEAAAAAAVEAVQ